MISEGTITTLRKHYTRSFAKNQLLSARCALARRAATGTAIQKNAQKSREIEEFFLLFWSTVCIMEEIQKENSLRDLSYKSRC